MGRAFELYFQIISFLKLINTIKISLDFIYVDKICFFMIKLLKIFNMSPSD